MIINIILFIFHLNSQMSNKIGYFLLILLILFFSQAQDQFFYCQFRKQAATTSTCSGNYLTGAITLAGTFVYKPGTRAITQNNIDAHTTAIPPGKCEVDKFNGLVIDDPTCTISSDYFLTRPDISITAGLFQNFIPIYAAATDLKWSIHFRFYLSMSNSYPDFSNFPILVIQANSELGTLGSQYDHKGFVIELNTNSNKAYIRLCSKVCPNTWNC